MALVFAAKKVTKKSLKINNYASKRLKLYNTSNNKIIFNNYSLQTSQKPRFFATQSKGQQLSEYALQHSAQGIGRVSNIVLEKGQGSHVWDVDGNKYLDFTCGIAVTNTGHCHPRVVKAAQDQVGKLIHGQVNIYFHQPMLDLTKKILSHVPSNFDRVFFANSGAEAIENAVKMARQATKKPNIITFNGSFHGRTIGTMSLTNSKAVYRTGFGPLMSGVPVTPFPYCYRCNTKKSDSVNKDKADYCCGNYETELKELLYTQSGPSEIAAILVEPILGEGGYVVPPAKFLQTLRKICTDNNILLIFDEVQTGFLRTGKWFAFEHFDVIPDIIVTAKGIASGFPLSAVISTTDIMKHSPAGSIGGTYTGNAVACAAGIATLQVMEDENIQDNVNKRSAELFAGLRQLQLNKQFHIGDVRGKGLMVAIEFDDKAPKGTANKVTTACLQLGMFLLTTGAHETIRIIPPLTCTKGDIQDCLDILGKALAKVF